MGRNDLCFCGSGKKIKKCHNSINENSIIAELYRKYNKIDKSISIPKDYPCKKGCDNCCYDYFYVSQIEFFCIYNYILLNNGYEYLYKTIQKSIDTIEYLKKNYNDEYVKLGSHIENQNAFDDTNIKSLNIPCIFLNNNMCDIYPVRPSMCRCFGTVKFFSQKCNKCKNYLLTNNITLAKLNYDTLINNIDEFKYHNIILRTRPFPLFYFFAMQSMLLNKNEGYIISINGTINQFIDYAAHLHKTNNKPEK